MKADKDSRGIITKIVSVEEIESNYSGRDRQEKIRNFIIDAYGRASIKSYNDFEFPLTDETYIISEQ